MASFYSGNQFEREFAATRLCNWEIPRCHRNKPAQRKTCTKIISNNRGHLLPGISRSKSNPWGDFKCTWELPNKITKEQAIALNTTKKSSKSVFSPKIDYHTDINVTDDLKYEPGDLTKPEQQHHSRTILTGKQAELPELNSLYVEQPPKSVNKETACNQPKITVIEGCDCGEKNETSSNKTEKLPVIDRNMRQEVSEKPGESNTIPLIPAYFNFQAAKKMAVENLEHSPLPDSIMDRAYRKMQAQGILNPEIALDVEPIATGVGVKTHNAGPTHCTKMKVYRPKTCGIVPPAIGKQTHDCRPQTAFNNKAKIEPMDLAICWDFRPANPRDEPKPPVHIDGSNGSAAPAVFTLVKTPRQNEEQLTGRSAGVFSHTAGEAGFFDKDIMMRNRSYFATQLKKNSDRNCHCENSPLDDSRSHSASRRHSANMSKQLEMKNRCKSSPNLSILVQASETTSPKENIIVCNYNKEHYHYRPETKRNNLTCDKKSKCDKLRPSRLCEQNINKLNRCINKPEFKFAFKAGVPAKSNSSGFCSSFDSCNNSDSTASEFTSKVIKIPKPRNPYAKKNYTIDTLAPPFACWKGGAGQGGYPEHWRLASVYQHAYKPVEQRKRPLLATVYQ